VAENLGLRLTESRVPEASEFTDLIEVQATNGTESASIAGTFFAGEPRIVKVNDATSRRARKARCCSSRTSTAPA
jgi:D-3-phosphoglycerate dehydrogenase / 2-oxoglutarate reductase